MRFTLIILSILISTLQCFAQGKKSLRKTSHQKGAMFVSWGYNRSAYTSSNFHFEGPGYDFTMDKMAAKDNQSVLGSGDYLKIATPQYNFKIGYNYMNSWSLSFAFDHLKYVVKDQSTTLHGNVLFAQNGTVTFGDGHEINNIELIYVPVTTHSSAFQYSYSGLNYMHVDLMKTVKLIGFGRRNWFVTTANAGMGVGLINSSTHFLYNGTEDYNVLTPVSGYGVSVFAGLRFEFVRHLYLYANLSPAFIHQVYATSRNNDQLSAAKHAFGLLQFDSGIGFLLYKRAKNKCDDCPVW